MSALHAATGGHDHSGRSVVVMVHGAGGNRTVWAAQARHLAARGMDVLAYDLPGHGQSEGPAHDTVEAYAAAVVADLDHRGIERFGIAGHSMGAMIALHIAGNHPDRVSHLALLGAGLELSVNDALLDGTREDPATAIDAIVDWGHSAGTHVGGGQTPGLWMDGVDTAIMTAEVKAHPGSLHADFQASNSYNGADAASAVTCPTLVIAGQNDMMTPAKMGRTVAAAIDGADYVEYPGCGHFMTTERPAEVCRAMARFFGG